MKKLILLFALVLIAAPLMAQDDGGGGGGGIFTGGDLGNRAPNAPPVDHLLQLKKILADNNAALTPAQDKSINAMIDSEIKKYTADLEKKFPEEVAAARAAAATGPRGGGGGGGRNAAGGGAGFGGGGGQPGAGGRGPGAGAPGAAAGGRGGAGRPVPVTPMTTEMARINVELQSKVTDALKPEQQTALKKYQTDQIRKAGGFAAMKLNMQEAGTPLSVEQESQIQALYNEQDQQRRQLMADSQGQPDPAKLSALQAQIGPKLLKVLNADQKKTMLDAMKKQPPR